MRLAEPDLSTTSRILSLAAADDFHEKKFEADEAPFMMEVLQKVRMIVLPLCVSETSGQELDRICTQKDSQRLGRKYLKSIHHLNRVHGVLPPSMFLTGLTRESETAVAGGGFADVWIGRLDKQRVCIKVLRFFQQGSERLKLHKALNKEALMWRQFNHPNILPFLGVNTELFAPSFCIVSPWMSNGDIIAYAQNRSLDLDAKLQHTIQIAEGLLYLHELDPPVVHGDIKGANVLISDDHRCCLADFGLSVLDTQSMNPTITSTVQGSLRWLAPEFINPTPILSQGRLTPRDIYAFGCTVFEILTGQPPFSHLNLDITVAIDVLKGVRPVLPPSVVPKDTVFKLIRVLLDSCWAEKIAQRPDVRAVLDFLKQVYDLLHLPEKKLESFSRLPVLNGLGIAPNGSRVAEFLSKVAEDTTAKAVSIYNDSSSNGGILPLQSAASLANTGRFSKRQSEPHTGLLPAPFSANPRIELPPVHGNSWLSRRRLAQRENGERITPVRSFSQSSAKPTDINAWEPRPTRYLFCFIPVVKQFRQSSSLSCVECARRKVKCNAAKSFPCSCCVKKGLPCGLLGPTPSSHNVLVEPISTLRFSRGGGDRDERSHTQPRPTFGSIVADSNATVLDSAFSNDNVQRFPPALSAFASRRTTKMIHHPPSTVTEPETRSDRFDLIIPMSMPTSGDRDASRSPPPHVNQFASLENSDDQLTDEPASRRSCDDSSIFPERNLNPEGPVPLSWTNPDLFQAWQEYQMRQTQTLGGRQLPTPPLSPLEASV